MAEARARSGLLAVLTGDIVGSSSLAPAKLSAVIAAIESGATKFESVYRGSIAGKADAYRGDSWQIAMTAPHLSLRLALYLRATILGGGIADTRISIGIGAGNTLKQERISLSTGDAFLRSGRGLDTIGAGRFSLAMPDAPADTDTLARCVVSLLDQLAAGWSVKQADAARRVLERPGKPDADVADARLSDSERRNFTKLRNRAHVDRVLDALTAFESLSFWDAGP
ncbi:MAG: hypothetical protein WAU86_05125 [Oricola sp.]